MPNLRPSLCCFRAEDEASTGCWSAPTPKEDQTSGAFAQHAQTWSDNDSVEDHTTKLPIQLAPSPVPWRDTGGCSAKASRRRGIAVGPGRRTAMGSVWGDTSAGSSHSSPNMSLGSKPSVNSFVGGRQQPENASATDSNDGQALHHSANYERRSAGGVVDSALGRPKSATTEQWPHKLHTKWEPGL